MICSTKKLMIDAKVSKFMNTQISQSLCQLDSNIVKKGPQTTKNRLSVKKNLFNLDNTNKQSTVDDFYFQQIDEKQKTVKIVTENSILKEKKENLLSLMNSGRGNKCLNESAITIMKQKQQINELLRKKKQLQGFIQASNRERKQQKEEYQEKHSKLMTENQQLIENNNQLKKYIEAITNQNNTLKSEKQKTVCQKEQCQVKLQTLSRQHNLTIIKLDEVTEKLESLNRSSDLLNKQFQQQLSPNKILSTKFKLVQITQQEQRQNENSLTKIEQDEQILERIQQKIKRLQIDLEYFIQTCNKLKKQNTKLKLEKQTQKQKDIEQKQDQILIFQNRLQQEHAKLINQNRQLELSNESLTLEIRSLSQKLAHSSASTSLITSQLHSYKEEYQTLKKRHLILQTEFKKYQGLIEAHIQLKQNYSQLQTNYLALYHSYKSLYQEYMDKSSQKDFIHQLNSSHSLLFQQSPQQDSNSNNSHRLYQIHPQTSLPIRANADDILNSHQPSLSSECNSSSSALTINNPPKIILQDLIKETLSTL